MSIFITSKKNTNSDDKTWHVDCISINLQCGVGMVERLKEIVHSRYGKGLEVRSMMDIANLNLKSDAQIKGVDLHIPIQVNGSYLGTAVVKEGSDLNDQQTSSLVQLVRMALEPSMYNTYLERKERNLQEINKAQYDVSNLSVFGEVDNYDFTNDSLSENNELQGDALLVSNLIHLEGTQETLIKKVALQLHEMTHRWAFVPFKDIREQIKNVEDLIKFGAMTIFIEKVETLSATEQAIINEFVDQARTDEDPLIITTSQKNMMQLRNDPQLGNIILDELSVNSFEVDHSPLSYQNLREVLELFFFKSSRQNPN